MLQKPLKKKNNKAKRMKLLKPIAITEAATERKGETARKTECKAKIKANKMRKICQAI